ncbi:methyl-accepting chemotaxis protein [Undibacterium sp. SXout11W]|uniref:methyl-accepting chemotaxis protein n=1 Tax=Undibacterium sp. SXout11W TaxID=3413050 RepID=UPI003BF431B3
MSDGQSIVSKTDLKGIITYCNPYFIEISGYEQAELIGKPHNLVRHPDMPEAAFADLWSTIKEGLPWSGIVKNRCKNGDHYWVNANVTPLIENGHVVGYMSVRTKPGRAEVKAAEDLYHRMRTGQAEDLQLKHGIILSTTLGGKILNALQMPAHHRLALGMSITLLFLVVWGGLHIAAEGVSLWNISGLIASITLVIYQWFVIQTTLLNPIQSALDSARAIAGGDLTRNIPLGDDSEMGQLIHALRQMNINLVSIIGDVRTNVGSISTGTQEIADANLDLSSRTESQASSLQKTAASMAQFADNVRQNSANANQANQLADQTSTIAKQGGEMVNRVGVTMQEINTSAKKIESIISLIDGIAFQTNILALNAAVEAARAGEQGRGFAVVASEVRNLAQRSASAAKEIKVLIDDSVSKVTQGNHMVNDTTNIMQTLVESVQKVTQVIHEISAASGEQSVGVEQMNNAVSQMEDITQQNAAMVEQAAASAANLAAEAKGLEQAVSVFILDRTHVHGPSIHRATRGAQIENKRNAL